MIGFIVRKDYGKGRTLGWAYLQRRPIDGAWLWTYSGDTATPMTDAVATAIVETLRRQDRTATFTVQDDYYRRAPQVSEVPSVFSVVAA